MSFLNKFILRKKNIKRFFTFHFRHLKYVHQNIFVPLNESKAFE